MLEPTFPIAAQKTASMLGDLWTRKRPVVEERLTILECAATGPLTEPLRVQARDVAHKLAGSLGMFGFPQGTEIARELELILESPSPDPASIGRLTTQLRQILFPQS